jgi:hypothetical protein
MTSYLNSIEQIIIDEVGKRLSKYVCFQNMDALERQRAFQNEPLIITEDELFQNTKHISQSAALLNVHLQHLQKLIHPIRIYVQSNLNYCSHFASVQDNEKTITYYTNTNLIISFNPCEAYNGGCCAVRFHSLDGSISLTLYKKYSDTWSKKYFGSDGYAYVEPTFIQENIIQKAVPYISPQIYLDYLSQKTDSEINKVFSRSIILNNEILHLNKEIDELKGICLEKDKHIVELNDIILGMEQQMDIDEVNNMQYEKEKND